MKLTRNISEPLISNYVKFLLNFHRYKSNLFCPQVHHILLLNTCHIMSRHSYTTEYIILYLTTILSLFTKHLVDAAALTKGTDVSALYTCILTVQA
jgi:hypothetical protein